MSVTLFDLLWGNSRKKERGLSEGVDDGDRGFYWRVCLVNVSFDTDSLGFDSMVYLLKPKKGFLSPFHNFTNNLSPIITVISLGSRQEGETER